MIAIHFFTYQLLKYNDYSIVRPTHTWILLQKYKDLIFDESEVVLQNFLGRFWKHYNALNMWNN